MNTNYFHKPRSKILPQIVKGVEKERRAICSDRIKPRGCGNSHKWDYWDKWDYWENWRNWRFANKNVCCSKQNS